ncbi:Polymerase/histidinol phosphatase-like protein, partial [Phakopsora pachyrhizi]
DLLDQFVRFAIEANQLKELYNLELELLIGLETKMIERSVNFKLLENLLETHRPSIDYIVGSVHHVNQIPIDFDLETFNRALCSFKPPRVLTSDQSVEAEEEGDDSLRLLCEAYFQAQYDLINSYQPEVIGHFDLCLLFHPKFYLTQHQSLWNQVERNIRLAISYGAFYEVNSASIRKGWSTPYPSKPILSVSLCGKLTLSDDSHGPERVSENYSESYNYLRDNGV